MRVSAESTWTNGALDSDGAPSTTTEYTEQAVDLTGSAMLVYADGRRAQMSQPTPNR